ncbi:MAG: protein kinase [Deltaproteobacteria bacterium]|nr:protein kinase [Deltaproteobacteria bacterium]
MKKINILEKIQNALQTCQEAGLRHKLSLFLEAQGPAGVVAACRRAGKAPRFYYYWWNRFRDSGFELQALREKSRRPRRSPRKTPAEVERRVLQLARESGEGLEGLRLRLEREHRVRLSTSTIHRILRARGEARPPRGPRAGRARSTAARPFPAPREPAGADALPRRLAGRYELLEEIGRGGAGLVYLARDLGAGGTRVALKTLALDEGTRPELIRAFENEFRALSSLQHPHLAKVFDFGTGEGLLYFSSEYLPGGDFLEACRTANLNTVLRWLVQVLGALDFLHGRGLLHLDLKPGNVLLAQAAGGERIVKLIDFGTAAWLRGGPEAPARLLGTPPYAAPEVLLEEAASPASDLYSFGMLCHRVLAGGFPFAASDPVAMLQEQIYGEAPPARRLPAALPESFSEFLARATARDPRRRFSGAREALAALNECLGEDFSLLARSAPPQILAGSERAFRPALLDELLGELQRQGPRVIVVSGEAGSGKRRLLDRLKAALQLRGLRPLHLGAERCRELVDSPSPLLVSGAGLSRRELVSVLDLLEARAAPALLLTEEPAGPDLNPHRWIRLEPLTLAELAAFLAAELADFPAELAAPLHRLCAGRPPRLEQALQALREFGMIQWSDRGWRWNGGTPASLDDLFERHEALWRERLAETQELLACAEAGLGAATLAGILGVDANLMEARLEDWSREGLLRRRSRLGMAQYFSASKPEKEGRPPALDETRTLETLTSLYRQGRYAAGAEWMRALAPDAAAAKALPAAVAVHGARHLAAAGFSEEALGLLPSEPPREAGLRGLHHEVRARAALASGDAETAAAALDLAEAAYGEARDLLGDSRVANLRALLAKRRGDAEAAEACFQMAIEAARAGGDAYHEAMAWMNLALLDYDQGRWSRCQQAYREAFAREPAVGQPQLSCKLRENWINLLLYLGKTEEAEARGYELLKISLHAGYHEQQAAALNVLAQIAGQRGEFARRLALLEQALSILDPARHPQWYFQCRHDRGLLQYEAQKYAAAQLDAEAALEIAERRSQPAWLAMARLLLGRVLRDRPRPDLDGAARALNLAHHAAWQLGIRPLLWEIDWERGRLARRRQERERARNYFLSARRELESLLPELPPALRQSYLRDRKLERIAEEIRAVAQDGDLATQLPPEDGPKMD